MEKKINLSALVVARNEEKQIADCLQTLSFCDEIIVIADRCTDQMVALAQKAGAIVKEGSWAIEGERRQAGQDLCNGQWIIEVDADERVSPALAEEILETLASRAKENQGPDWWRVPFHNYVGKRLVLNGWGAHFGVGAKAILYRKGIKNWGNEQVHPKVQMKGNVGTPLQNPMIHYVDQNISDMLHRLDRYTTLHAIDLIANNDQSTYKKNVFRIFGRFWKSYVRRKGHREGVLGLVIAILTGLYPFLSYAKAQEMKDNQQKRQGSPTTY